METNPFIGEIRLFGFNYAPRNWAQCNGQLLSISNNESLFSLLGTMYGGDGRTTFGLPDLRGRSPIHQGQGPGLNHVNMGQKGGRETTTLSANNLPIGQQPKDINVTKDSDTQTVSVNEVTSGANQSFNNRPPFQVVNYCIALNGTYPPRS